jgi:hypothetical protein
MKPFRLTPESLNRIKKYAADRRSAGAIARLLACSVGTIENIAREHGIDIVKDDGAPPLSRCRPTFAGGSTIVLEVPIGSAAMEQIRQEANRRGCKPAALVARMAEIVATDKIFAAVLDK